VTAPDLLATIVAATRRAVDVRRQHEPEHALAARARARQPRGDAFLAAVSSPGINVIAECKRRSPSRGVLRAAYDPVLVAQGYERAGAVALSILTEPTFFDGALDHLRQVRDAVALPLLRKDFVVDPYQLLEARANGADAVLLIVAALSDRELESLLRGAEAEDLAALVEVHDVAELDRALAAGARLIGANNRNLRTLEVDVRASEDIASRLPREIVAVSESGLKTADDLHRLQSLGYRAFLIGERFMTAAEPGEALADLLRAVASPAAGGSRRT
jgi:indole-3-glycerol phosphate synthase